MKKKENVTILRLAAFWHASTPPSIQRVTIRVLGDSGLWSSIILTVLEQFGAEDVFVVDLLSRKWVSALVYVGW